MFRSPPPLTILYDCDSVLSTHACALEAAQDKTPETFPILAQFVAHVRGLKTLVDTLNTAFIPRTRLET